MLSYLSDIPQIFIDNINNTFDTFLDIIDSSNDKIIFKVNINFSNQFDSCLRCFAFNIINGLDIYGNIIDERIYKANFEYVGTDFGYLIGGTIKFANPVEKNEDDTYTAHMIADIYGIEMKTGKVIYEQTIEYTSSGANWNKAVDNCKTKLTAMTVDSIMLGL